MSLNCIVFSKNRPAQLELLLRSYKKFFKEWKDARTTIIYRASDKEFFEGYKKVQQLHPEFEYSLETNFQQDVLKQIIPENPLTMCLVDDIVFKSNWSLRDEIFSVFHNNPHMVAISLRLHRGIDHCFAIDQPSPAPNFRKEVPGEYLIWSFKEYNGTDWGYPYSVDGNAYNTNLIASLLSRVQFQNPNTLEAILNDPRIISQSPPYMACYNGPSKLLNVPANKVQVVFNNRCLNSYSTKELNEKFLGGKLISLENIETITDNNTVHYPVDYKFFEAK